MKKNTVHWAKALQLVDEKYLREADPVAHRRRKRNKHALLAACLCGLLLVSSLVLFLPVYERMPEISAYKNSAYYPVISAMGELTLEKLPYKNNFERLKLSFYGSSQDRVTGNGELAGPTDNDILDSPSQEAPGAPTDTMEGEAYVEVTDNQVKGVTEADRIKRSDSHLYYLDTDGLRVYSIAEDQSELVGTYPLGKGQYVEFYLSKDCKTVLLFSQAKQLVKQKKQADAGIEYRNLPCIHILALDVSDPTQIQKKQELALTGIYRSSRLTEKGLLLFATHTVDRGELDFADETSYLPQVNDGDGFDSLPPESIHVPENCSKLTYQVVMLLEEESFALLDTEAYLSYSEIVYVSKEDIFLTNYTSLDNTTEISRLSYTETALEPSGKTQIEGFVKDQYSMDVYEGTLRVVTTTQRSEEIVFDGREVSLVLPFNANLYCIDVQSMKQIACVLEFAPEGERVRSVRFDGANAYVCTSLELLDPVFFFDLSDPEDIRMKQTDEIPGFSTSLVDFGDGLLLGIGVGGGWGGSLKIELFREGEYKVESVDAFVISECSFSSDYKAYYIDRENRLIGLGYRSYTETTGRYLLLHFNGEKLERLLDIPLNGNTDAMRGVYIDGWMYLLGQQQLRVLQPGDPLQEDVIPYERDLESDGVNWILIDRCGNEDLCFESDDPELIGYVIDLLNGLDKFQYISFAPEFGNGIELGQGPSWRFEFDGRGPIEIDGQHISIGGSDWLLLDAQQLSVFDETLQAHLKAYFEVEDRGLRLLPPGKIVHAEVSSLPAGFHYAFDADKTERLVEYLKSLALQEELDRSPEGCAGMTWVISLTYENGETVDVYHFANLFVRTNNSPWYQMRYEQANHLGTLLGILSREE